MSPCSVVDEQDLHHQSGGPGARHKLCSRVQCSSLWKWGATAGLCCTSMQHLACSILEHREQLLQLCQRKDVLEPTSTWVRVTPLSLERRACAQQMAVSHSRCIWVSVGLVTASATQCVACLLRTSFLMGIDTIHSVLFDTHQYSEY